jgi:hypothetical protein
VTANKTALVTLRVGNKKLSKPLTNATKATYSQVYAPDGRSIAITRASRGPTSTVPVRGGKATPLGPFSISGWAPQPTGRAPARATAVRCGRRGRAVDNRPDHAELGWAVSGSAAHSCSGR